MFLKQARENIFFEEETGFSYTHFKKKVFPFSKFKLQSFLSLTITVEKFQLFYLKMFAEREI